MTEGTGKLLIIIGSLLIAAGIVVIFRDSIPFLKHIGRLPGDISIKRENFSVHFPIVTCIIISVIASIILYIIKRLH